MPKRLIIAVTVLTAVAAGGFLYLKSGINADQPDPFRIESRTIPAGITFSQLAGQVIGSTSTVNQLIEKSRPVYDLATIVAGRNITFYFDRLTGEFRKLVYNIDTDTVLAAVKTADGDWQVATSSIPYEIRRRTSSGVITSSLYQTMLANNYDQRLALALAETFAWQIDFAADIQNGDRFKVIYEERYLDGKYVMPGKILAAEFINQGERFRGYYFEGAQGKSGYYDENGNSLQKQFLKSPLQYKYISSGFTYKRINPVTGALTPHRGIDYAANYGTPAVSVGDGTVVQAGWNGPLGLSVKVRHNDTYTTVYGHFSSLAKGIRVGAKVKQGQIVGYVGATGEATGPHLHYEMHKFGAFINPFKEVIPPGEPIAEADRTAFAELRARYDSELDGMAVAGICPIQFNGGVVAAEIAADDQSRTKGLSGRYHLGENDGMLFVFGAEGKPDFWMKDTVIPLDIVWISKSHRVVGIEKGVRPPKAGEEPRVYTPPADVFYVLEVNAGWSDRMKLEPGAALKFSC